MSKELIAAVAALASVQAFAEWTFDSTAKTLTGDDGVVLKAAVVSSAEHTLRITGVTDLSGADRIDLSAPITSVGDAWHIVWISNKSFMNQPTIVSVTLPDTLEIIGESAFEGTASLVAVSPFLPGSVTNIGQKAFLNAPVSGTLRLSSPLLREVPAQCFNVSNEMARITSVDMSGSGVLSIGQKAFMQQTNIVSVTLSDGLEVLDTGAFWNCYSLRDVAPFLPAHVRIVGGRAFSGAPVSGMLTASNRNLTTIGANAFDVGDDALPFSKIEAVDLAKSGVESVNMYAFRGQRRLSEIKFPATLATVGDYSFKNCTNLTHVYYSNDFGAGFASTAKPFDGAIKRSKQLTIHILRGLSSWESYMSGHGRSLTEEEVSEFESMHPGERIPVALVPYPYETSTTLAYLSYWSLGTGLSIFIR